MGWLDDLAGKTVGIDTSPLIFYIEENPTYKRLVDPFFEAVGHGSIQVIASTVNLAEVLVHPLRLGNESLAHRYNDILVSSPNVSTVPVTVGIAQSAAELRAQHGFKTPDAILMATAMMSRADAFLTNDRNIKDISSIHVLKLCDLLPRS